MELPSITFEEALKKEEEYKKKLRTAQPQLIFGPNLQQAPIKETASLEPRPAYYSEPGAQRFPVQSQSHTSVNQRPLPPPQPPLLPTPPPPVLQPTPKPNQQQRNWPQKRARVPPQRLPPYVHISRPAQPNSYWCKLCKIDCTTEQNFRAHIGGKRHQAKKLLVLQGRSNASGESSRTHNRRNTNQDQNQNQNQNENENTTSECEVRQEGEALGPAPVRKVESVVENAGPSNVTDGLIDLTTDE